MNVIINSTMKDISVHNGPSSADCGESTYNTGLTSDMQGMIWGEPDLTSWSAASIVHEHVINAQRTRQQKWLEKLSCYCTVRQQIEDMLWSTVQFRLSNYLKITTMTQYELLSYIILCPRPATLGLPALLHSSMCTCILSRRHVQGNVANDVQN